MLQFDIRPDIADKVRPNRRPKPPPPVQEPASPPAESRAAGATTEDILSTSA